MHGADDQDLTVDGEVAAAPANVPNAKCWTKDTPQGVGTKCLVQHGQYVGEITAMDDEKKAHQLTAA